MTHRKRISKAAQRETKQPLVSVDQLRAWCLAGFTAIVVATPFVPSEATAERGTHVVFVALWLVLSLSWWLGKMGRAGAELRCDYTLLAIVAFTAWQIVSCLAGLSAGHARFGLNMLWHWFSVGLAFFMARQVLRSAVEARALCVCVCGVAIMLTAFGFYQYAYSMPQARALFAADPERAIAEAGLSAPPGSPQRAHFENRLENDEPTATFALTNSFAGVLAPWCVWLVAVSVAAWSSRSRLKYALPAFVAALVALVVMLWFTQSRSAWLAVAVGVVLAIVYARNSEWNWLWKWPALVGGVAVALLFVGVGAGLLDWQLVASAPTTVLYRLQYWHSTALMIADHPWFGCGAGNFQDYYTAYKLPEASEVVQDPHNFLLETWACSGTPGLLLLLLVPLAILLDLRRRSPLLVVDEDAERSSPYVAYVYGGAAAGGLLAFVAAIIAQYPLDGFLGTSIPAALLLGLPVAALFVAVCHPWTLHGEMPAATVLAAMTTSLLHLLAAGGWAYPGVAISLWVPLAAMLAKHGPAARVRRLGVPACAAALVATVAAFVLFHFTAYSPVLVSRTHVDQAEAYLTGGELFERTRQGGLAADQYARAVTELRAAAQADKYDSTPQLLLARAYLGLWTETNDPSWYAFFEDAAARSVSLQSRSSSLHQQLGDMYLAAWRHRGEPQQIERALELYTTAVERYPTHNQLHTQLAWTFHLAGKTADAQAAARLAAELDAQCPHEELQLRNRTVVDPGPGAKTTHPQPPAPKSLNAAELLKQLLAEPPG